MKKKLLLLLVFFVVIFYVLSQSSFHEDRNKHNLIPVGVLTPVGDQWYKDETDRIWELQPQIKNKFHQPSSPVPPIPVPYPNVEGSLEFDPKSPNWKFLSEVKEGSGSYEAILQPDGTYLTTGTKQGTYNYGHPSGFWGSVRHTFLDLIPHFFNDDYSH
jgi:hypothetical protein